MNATFTIVLQIILILINAFFAGTEIAVVSLNIARLKKEAEEGDKKSKRLLKMVENPSDFLSAIQISITLAGFLGAAFSADVLSEGLVELFQKWGWNANYGVQNTIAVIIITIIISFFTLIFGELVPKRIAQQKPIKWARMAAGIVNAVSIFFKPFVWLLSFCTNLVLKILHLKTSGGEEEVTEEDIRLMVETSGESGKIEEDEQEWIQNVFDFNDATVESVMTRTADVTAIQEDMPENEILEIIRETGYSRFPVYGDDFNDIKGILISREILLNSLDGENKQPIKNLIRSPYIVPESVHADKLFSDMQAKKIHFAIVFDEYGSFAGIITLEDLIEEIVGNIYDEFDEAEEEEVVELEKNQWSVSGDTAIEDFNEETHQHIPLNDDYDTIGGLVLSTCSTFPDDGEVIDAEQNGYSFHVDNIHDRKIENVIVKKLPPQKEKNTLAKEEEKKDNKGGK